MEAGRIGGRRPHRAMAGALLAMALAPALAQDALPSPEQLFEKIAPSVWMVQTADATGRPLASGSAVVVGAGQLVTNCHVLEKAHRAAVVHENVSYGATFDLADPERDLCLLKVANFTAPPVQVAGLETLKTGSRVYAVGNPRGYEQTFSDGLLSGLRRLPNGDVHLQITVPISPGSSGGGLFDSRGRLVGITTYGRTDAQSINFALPASMIAEIAPRAEAAKRRPAMPAAGSRASQVFEYRLRDRIANLDRSVVYRLDRIDGDRLLFNQGSRVELRNGDVVSLSAAIGGEFELAMPPGGWTKVLRESDGIWEARYENTLQGARVAMELRARPAGQERLRVQGRELRVQRVEFTGYTARGSGLAGTGNRGSYAATAWYSPELARVVRFEARGRGGSGGAAILLDEVLELVDVRVE